MARIFGVELKNFKLVKGHDDSLPYTASIYLDDKKIGTAENDGWGGPDNINFKDEKVAEEFARRKQQYFDKYPSDFTSDDIFLYELIELLDKEKAFKKALKKGYTAYMHLSDPAIIGINRPYLRTEAYLVASEKDIEKLLQKSKHSKKEVYRSLEDFIIE